jgi:glutathione S-transferase
MSIELHWLSGSPYAWRVMLALELKGVAYASRLHQLSTGELQSAEYLALNPRGRVPTLVDDGFVLYESLAILAYLDRKFPAPSLFGQSARETGLIWRHIAEYTAYTDPATEALILPLYFGTAREHAASVKEAAATLHVELGRLEAALTENPFLAGAGPSAADLVVYPHVKSIERAASKDAARDLDLDLLPLPARWPQLGKWMARIEALPGYQKTYPPHWR